MTIVYTIPNPDGEGRVRVTVLGTATHQPTTVPDARMESGERLADQLRVRFDEGEREGTVKSVPRSDVEPPWHG